MLFPRAVLTAIAFSGIAFASALEDSATPALRSGKEENEARQLRLPEDRPFHSSGCITNAVQGLGSTHQPYLDFYPIKKNGNHGVCRNPWMQNLEIRVDTKLDCMVACKWHSDCIAIEWMKDDGGSNLVKNCELFYLGNKPSEVEVNDNYECWTLCRYPYDCVKIFPWDDEWDLLLPPYLEGTCSAGVAQSTDGIPHGFTEIAIQHGINHGVQSPIVGPQRGACRNYEVGLDFAPDLEIRVESRLDCMTACKWHSDCIAIEWRMDGGGPNNMENCEFFFTGNHPNRTTLDPDYECWTLCHADFDDEYMNTCDKKVFPWDHDFDGLFY